MDNENIANPKTKNLRTFMVWIHVIAYSLMPFTKTKFWLSFYSDSPIRFYCAIFIFSASFAAYKSCVRNPGFVKPSDDPENPNQNPNEEDNKKNSIYFYCTHCKQHIPLRASHCRHCQRCILRRDHHCPFTGQCIGRDNHFAFLLWCYLEVFLVLSVTGDLFASLFHYSEFTNNIHNYYYHDALITPSKLQLFLSYMSTFKANLFILPFLLFDGYQAILLSINHTLLAFNNITTWELTKRKTISYFQSYPITSNPFNKGIFKNFYEFVIMSQEKMKWNNPPPPDLDDFIDEYQMFGVAIMSSLVSMFFY